MGIKTSLFVYRRKNYRARYDHDVENFVLERKAGIWPFNYWKVADFAYNEDDAKFFVDVCIDSALD